MNDTKTTIEQLKQQVEQFVTERDWVQFHSPKNVSISIVCEATELMDLFKWDNDTKQSVETVESKRLAVEQEAADVLISLLAFCNRTNIDITSAVQEKIKHNAEKYPVEKAKGRSCKYTDL